MKPLNIRRLRVGSPVMVFRDTPIWLGKVESITRKYGGVKLMEPIVRIVGRCNRCISVPRSDVVYDKEWAVGDGNMEKTVIKSEHKKILDKIRELYIQSGGKPLYEPEDFGLNDLRKSGSGMEMDFDYGVPHFLYTPDGSYMILGSNVVGDTKKFWDLLNQAFEVEIIKPKRNDAEVSGLEFQCQISGPVVRIREKNS